MMKRITRILALALALLMLLPMVLACSKTSNDEDETSASVVTTGGDDLYDANGYLKDSLPELDFEGYEFKILTWESGYGGDFYVPEDTGIAVEDEVYRRNLVVQERLNVKLSADFIEGGNSNQQSFVSNVSNNIMAGGTSPYDLIGSYSMSAGTLAMNGMCANLNEFDYLDLEKPWWPEGIVEGSTFNGNLYFITGDLANSLIYNLYFLVVNKDMLAQLKLDDPREMVMDGTWTLDAMIEMTKKTYSDDDSISGPSDGDIYGWGSHANVHYDSFLCASGIRASAEDEQGVLRLTDDFTGQKTHDLIVKINNWLHGSGDCYYGGESMTNFKLGKLLFSTYAATDVIRVLKDAEIDYGIVPFPKYDEEQAQHYCNVSFQHSLLSVPITVRDGDVSAAVLECMGSEAYRSSAPFVFENMLKSRFSNDALDGEMYDILKANVYVDATRLFSSSFTFAQSAVGMFRYSINDNKSTWMSDIGTYKRTINDILKNITTTMNG